MQSDPLRSCPTALQYSLNHFFFSQKRGAVVELVFFLFPQLHTIVTDESCGQVSELYQQEQGNLATGGSSATQHTRILSEAAYQKRSESLLTDENCYKVVIVSLVAVPLVC